MSTVHLFHGFNVSDGGLGTIVRWVAHLQHHGLDWWVHDYGWTGPLRLRLRNRSVVRGAREHVREGDILAGHSNGALICWQLVQAGVRPAAVVIFQPALRRDKLWPDGVPVLCVYNRADWTVQMGRAWGRLATAATWQRHGWGAAGRYGLTAGQPLVHNHRTDNHPLHPVRGHSTIFTRGAGLYHLDYAARWAAHYTRKGAPHDAHENPASRYRDAATAGGRGPERVRDERRPRSPAGR